MLRLLAIPAVLVGLLAAALVWSGEGRLDRADFAFVNRGDHVTLDLNNMAYMQDIRVANAIWEGLYALNPATLEPELATADKVTVSDDRRRYTFHIRDSARWSNGDKVTAGDFLFEWRRMLQSPKEYTYLHHYIKGAQAYEAAYEAYAAAPADRKPPVPDFAAVGERVNPDGTLTVELANPVPFFPNLLAFVPFYPMHERSMAPFRRVDAATGEVTYDSAFTRPPNLVTNGPFRLADWTFKRRVRLAANEHYWDAAHVRSRTIDEVQADDSLAAYRLYQQGQVDWLSDVDPALAEPLLHEHRPDLHVFKAFGTYYYELNCEPTLKDGRKNPLADVRVRQALAMAIDKEPIVRDVGRLDQPVATDFIPPGVFPGYRSPPGLPYDVTRARALLAAAGYPDGRGFPAIAITYNTEGGGLHGDIATIVRRQWADHLGIDVSPDAKEQKQYAADLHTQHYAVARASWYGDYFDPSTFTDKYLSDSDNNAAHWNDADYDETCVKAAAEPDPAKRLGLFAAAEDRLLDQAPIVPLYTYVSTYLYRSDVHGITPNAQGTVLFKGIYRDGVTR